MENPQRIMPFLTNFSPIFKLSSKQNYEFSFFFLFFFFWIFVVKILWMNDGYYIVFQVSNENRSYSKYRFWNLPFNTRHDLKHKDSYFTYILIKSNQFVNFTIYLYHKYDRNTDIINTFKGYTAFILYTWYNDTQKYTIELSNEYRRWNKSQISTTRTTCSISIINLL